MCQEKRLTAAHLCCGIGGMALGFQEVGFDPVYANDIFPLVAKTFEENVGISVEIGDVNQISMEDLPSFDVLTASFPRISSHMVSENGVKNHILKGIYQVVQTMKPKVFCLSSLYCPSVDEGNPLWCQEDVVFFKKLGYTIQIVTLSDQEDAGCPTPRKEQFIVGFLEKEQAARFKKMEYAGPSITLADCIQVENSKAKSYYLSRFNPSVRNQLIESLIPEEKGIYQIKSQYPGSKDITLNDIIPLNPQEATMQLVSVDATHPRYLIRDDKGIRVPTIEEWLKIKGFPDSFELATSPSRGLKSLTAQYREAAIQISSAMSVPLAKQIALAIKATF